ncbi:hypothetical protein Micbo1qcDRAFT_218421 [Microdochium bolleyi]|uniref:1-alkyl-2-acetylglycerophosphocholine esterase n=1 Tax=Microdochium bolleyi TaxID=196109 RepID=A0A136IQE6_9PEZI|nr:hypothetical protein Micbo1qcDRAFT_218421 [Microdochium bolleyi]
MRFITSAVLATTLATTPVLSRTITAPDHASDHTARQQQEPAQLSLPDTTGPHKVGTVAFPLTDYSRIDPLAAPPNTTSTTHRRLMVSVFYPAALPGIHNYTYAPVFPPATAALLDANIGAPAGTAATLRTRSYLGAPILLPPQQRPKGGGAQQDQKKNEEDFPVLFFGHGFGGMRLAYAARLQELASRGWVVVNIDHTYDAQIVEFSDTGAMVPAYAADPAEYTVIGGVEGLQKLRATDVKFVLGQLRANETVRAQVPGLGKASSPSSPSCGSGDKGPKKGLKMDRVGVLGHSLGGAGAAQAVSSHHADGFVCGANLDGALWGDLPADGLLTAGAAGASKGLSFLQVSNGNITRATRPSWGVFWDVMKEQKVGLQRQFGVKGAEHNSFGDANIYYHLLGGKPPVDVYGTIDPLQMLKVEVGYVDAFFGVCLKGKSVQELDGLSKTKFPETFAWE